jgi:5-methylcytosine-specific restriction protein A
MQILRGALLMARSVPVWIGKTDDTPIPARVRLRVVERAGYRCQACGADITPANTPEIDHILAIKLGGENSESNLQCLCFACHAAKTLDDVAAKAKDERIKKKHFGLMPKKAKIPGSKGTRWKKKIGGLVIPR